LKRAGWDGMIQIREDVTFTKGRIPQRSVCQRHTLHTSAQ
jgi:hypothetical protein